MGLVSSVGARVGVCAAIVVGVGLDAAVAAGWVGAAVALGAVVGLAGSDGPGAPSEHAASVTAAAASAAVSTVAVWRMFFGVDISVSVGSILNAFLTGGCRKRGVPCRRCHVAPATPRDALSTVAGIGDYAGLTAGAEVLYIGDVYVIGAVEVGDEQDLRSVWRPSRIPGVAPPFGVSHLREL